jgi:hypothetical protein
MGGVFSKEYQPTGKWTKIRFIKKYSCQGNTNSIEKMIEAMDKTAKWLKSNANQDLIELDNNFLKKIKDIIGNKSDWLQNHYSSKYMEIQKDFRKIYKIKSFSWYN